MSSCHWSERIPTHSSCRPNLVLLETSLVNLVPSDFMIFCFIGIGEHGEAGPGHWKSGEGERILHMDKWKNKPPHAHCPSLLPIITTSLSFYSTPYLLFRAPEFQSFIHHLSDRFRLQYITHQPAWQEYCILYHLHWSTTCPATLNTAEIFRKSILTYCPLVVAFPGL